MEKFRNFATQRIIRTMIQIRGIDKVDVTKQVHRIHDQQKHP